MRYAFTGPSRLTPAGRNRAVQAVTYLVDPTEITTGGAEGWDVTVMFAALRIWPQARHRVITPAASYAKAVVAAAVGIAARNNLSLEVVAGPAATTTVAAYRARNEQLVVHADELVAGLYSETFYRSGEFMTVNIARRAGVPVRTILLEGGAG